MPKTAIVTPNPTSGHFCIAVPCPHLQHYGEQALELRMYLGPYLLPNPWILAPMAGASDMPFRVIVRECGAGAAPTELVSAKGLLHCCERTRLYLRHDSCEQPFWAQLFCGDPAAMAEGASRAVDIGARIVDLNMGCPVRKVTGDGAGAALHLDIPRAAAIARAVVRRAGVPVTAKIRIGWDATQINAVELAQALEAEGVVAIAVHGRTRAQAYSGTADWSQIRRVVQAVRVPVIGNGDVTTPELAHRLIAETGCRAVMIGRAALGNPWIFRRLVQPGYRGPTANERWAVVHRHLMSHLDFVGDESAGIRSFRPHMMWYARGISGAAEFRRIITRIDDRRELIELSQHFFEMPASPSPVSAEAELETCTLNSR